MGFNSFFYTTVLVLIGASALLSCNNTPAGNKPVNDTAKTNTASVNDSTQAPAPPPDFDTSDFAIEYLTIADTGLSYYKLRAEMFVIHVKLGWVIDTMERYYNTQKDEIVLSDTADDEIYRGEYFERRFTSQSMSLEYFRVYNDSSTSKNIALVCGLYETQKSADSLLSILKPNVPHAFVQKARLYMGCEH